MCRAPASGPGNRPRAGAPVRSAAGPIRSRLAAVGLAAVLFTAACESARKPSVQPGAAAPTTQGARAGPPPCSLITASEAEAFLGRPIGGPTTEADRCTWPATDGLAFVTVTVNTGEASRTMLDASRASDRGEPVTGIGDAAYVALPGNELGVVAFVDGQVAVSILVRSPTRNQAALLDLAGVAAGRA